MGDLLIRNIPEALKSEIEQLARRDGQSLSSKSIDLLRDSLLKQHLPDGGDRQPSTWDRLRAIMYDPDGDLREAEEFGSIMEEIEAERKRDFGRPLPDLE